MIYLSTFSKTLTPGLRLGWIVAPAEVIGKLVQLKQGADLQTSTFVQVVAHEAARGGWLDEHVHTLRRVYRERRDVMLESLEEVFPASMGVTWTRPQGGLFLWLRLPQGMTSTELLALALKQNGAFVPGAAFFASADEGRHYCRLNFSNAQPAMIEEGIRRIGTAVRHMAGEKEPVPA